MFSNKAESQATIHVIGTPDMMRIFSSEFNTGKSSCRFDILKTGQHKTSEVYRIIFMGSEWCIVHGIELLKKYGFQIKRERR